MEKETKRKAVYDREADKRWIAKNREHRRYLTDRSSSRRFIKGKATEEDLQELEALIVERRKDLSKQL